MLGITTDALMSGFNRSKKIEKGKQWSSPDTRFFEHSSCSIRYRYIEGNNSNRKILPTLVIIPDPPIMIAHYDSLAQTLSEHCNVLLFEMPGFGFSLPKKGLRLNAKAIMEVYTDFLKFINKGPYILHFPCVAGLSAVELANHWPQGIIGVVLTQTGTKEHSLQWRKTVDPKNLLGLPVLGQALLRSQREKMTRGWLNVALKDKSQLDEYHHVCHDAFSHGACFCLASALQGFLTPDMKEPTPLEQPTLVIWGEHDKTHRKTIKEDTRRLGKNTDFHIYHNSAHFPDLEESDKFVDHISGFVANL